MRGTVWWMSGATGRWVAYGRIRRIALDAVQSLRGTIFQNGSQRSSSLDEDGHRSRRVDGWRLVGPVGHPRETLLQRPVVSEVSIQLWRVVGVATFEILLELRVDAGDAPHVAHFNFVELVVDGFQQRWRVTGYFAAWCVRRRVGAWIAVLRSVSVFRCVVVCHAADAATTGKAATAASTGAADAANVTVLRCVSVQSYQFM